MEIESSFREQSQGDQKQRRTGPQGFPSDSTTVPELPGSAGSSNSAVPQVASLNDDLSATTWRFASRGGGAEFEPPPRFASSRDADCTPTRSVNQRRQAAKAESGPPAQPASRAPAIR